MKKEWTDYIQSLPVSNGEKALQRDLLENNKELDDIFKLGFMNTYQAFEEHGPETGFRITTQGRQNWIDSFNNLQLVRLERGGTPVQCASKCSYCCYQHVLVSSSEAFQISHLMARKGLDIPTEEIAERVANLNHLERFQQAIACPLLKNSNCSVYEDRPQVCRSYFSTTQKLCKASFERRWHDDAPWTKIIGGPQYIGQTMIMGTDAAIMNFGFQMVTLELADALTQARKPGAWEAWLSKDKVFQEPESNIPYPQVLHQMMFNVFIGSGENNADE